MNCFDTTLRQGLTRALQARLLQRVLFEGNGEPNVLP